jgi:hypothetical protein
LTRTSSEFERLQWTTMGKKRKIDPELLAQWEREREEFRELMQQRAARLDAAEAREAARLARLRRVTFGLLGRS